MRSRLLELSCLPQSRILDSKPSAMSVLELVREFAPWALTFVLTVGILLRIAVSIHVVMNKRQNRAAIAWVGLVLLAPFGGSIVYLLFGINRIQRRAASLRRGLTPTPNQELSPADLATLQLSLGEQSESIYPLARLVGEVTDLPLRPGNQVEPLVNGDAAYPAMLAAINSAQATVALSTYLFYDDAVGQAFAQALARAVSRGVTVRVLIDSLGSRYGWRSIVGRLRAAGVTVDTFLPTLVPAWIPFLNLRNHRKLLIIDGRTAYTGGMNIDARFLSPSAELALNPGRPGRHQPRHQDLHFKVQGPVVNDLMRVFADDWAFTTNERLGGSTWYPPLSEAGPTPARCVADGPEDDVDPLLKAFLGAIAVARNSITIATPYFLPDEPLLSALEVAALRGVNVEILVPDGSNLRVMNWAMPPFLERALRGGCHIGLVPPPFDHTKLMVVDDLWVFLGSANIDSRSLRLNFEVNLECYGQTVAASVLPILAARRSRATPLTLDALATRSFPAQVRDAFTSLLAPYL